MIVRIENGTLTIVADAELACHRREIQRARCTRFRGTPSAFERSGRISSRTSHRRPLHGRDSASMMKVGSMWGIERSPTRCNRRQLQIG